MSTGLVPHTGKQIFEILLKKLIVFLNHLLEKNIRVASRSLDFDKNIFTASQAVIYELWKSRSQVFQLIISIEFEYSSPIIPYKDSPVDSALDKISSLSHESCFFGSPVKYCTAIILVFGYFFLRNGRQKGRQGPKKII